MRDRTEQRVKSWESRPFSRGYAGLHDLADDGFSGVVVAAETWLFMLNGRVVGVVGGDVDDFEDASGTVYEAPDPSLPLLFSMRERGGQTQAKYYTNDTPLTEADETLSDANFTGFVELSENVLSGDYYLVYYGGRALPVAFVGTNEDLKTGEEAFELADDEVGVYEVVKVPVSVTEIPGDAEESTGTEEPAGAAGATETATSTEPATGADAESEPVAEAEPAAGSEPPADSEPAAESESDEEPGRERAERESASERSDEPAAAVERAEPAAGDRAAGPDDGDEAAAGAGGATGGDESAERATREADTAPAGQADAPESGEGEGESKVFQEEAEWRETKSIPSLSPSEREKRQRQRAKREAQAERQQQQSGAEQTSAREQQAAQESRGERSGATQQSQARPKSQAKSRTETRSSPDDGASRREQAASASQVDESRVTELESAVEELRAERDDLEDRLASVREERDELESTVADLERALENAGGASASGTSLDPADALQQTNLFVRYGSKGKATLDDLTGGDPDPDEINANLRIDHHTQFEAEDASVDGEPFEQFLQESSAYRFVNWFVRELPYEILDAGHRSGLADVYEVVPEVDRVELGGTVEVETDDGVERRDFDVVLRDRMGNALVVAELNDARDPVSGDEMEQLVDAAEVVGDAVPDLGGAFYVTASFFEPPALEAAADATGGGGLLSRSDKKSYVRVARKQGFHLCLAEDRNETFNLTVPEL